MVQKGEGAKNEIFGVLSTFSSNIVRYLPLQPVDCPSLFCKHIKFAHGPQPMLSLFSTELQQELLTEGLINFLLRPEVWGLWNILD